MTEEIPKGCRVSSPVHTHEAEFYVSFPKLSIKSRRPHFYVHTTTTIASTLRSITCMECGEIIMTVVLTGLDDGLEEQDGGWSVEDMIDDIKAHVKICPWAKQQK